MAFSRTFVPLALIAAPLFAGTLVEAGCSPAEEQSVLNVAEAGVKDVVQIAKVLCLADQAKMRHASVRDLTVQDVCKTVEQLAPYMAAAETPTTLASRGACP